MDLSPTGTGTPWRDGDWCRGFHRVHDEPWRLLFVFRNTLHYIVPMPETGKVGYFLVSLNGMPMERSLPKSIVPNGTGAY